MKERLTHGPHRLVGLQVGLASTTWWRLALFRSGLPSGVFWILPKSVSSRINMINSDIWVHLDGFLNKPC
jgi:hypothetical protein